jgi:hypothetical protein
MTYFLSSSSCVALSALSFPLTIWKNGKQIITSPVNPTLEYEEALVGPEWAPVAGASAAGNAPIFRILHVWEAI